MTARNEETTSSPRLSMKPEPLAAKASLEQLLALEEAAWQAEAFDAENNETHQANPVWREKVTQWVYQVIDHLQERRSVVYVAMHILDRYTAKHNTALSETTYELASLAALFLAVRTTGSVNLRLSHLLGMSRSSFATKDIITMGTKMIKALSWDHPLVTPHDLVKALCRELPCNLPEERKQEILDSATFSVELCVSDITLSDKKASHNALAALLNALNDNRSLSIPDFNNCVARITTYIPESRDLMETRIRMRQILNHCYGVGQVSSPHLIIDDDIPSRVSDSSLSSMESSVSSTYSSVESTVESQPRLKRVATDRYQRIFKKQRTEYA